MLQKLNPRFLVVFTVISAVVIFRVLHDSMQWNWLVFTPIGAMALFAGTHFTKKWHAFVFPIAILLISDVLLFSSTIFFSHLSGFFWSYLAFAGMVIIGARIKKVNITNVALAAIAAAFMHWAISDIGVWFDPASLNMTTGKPFERNIAGFVACYAQAIPFSMKMLAGNLIFGAVFYGGFALLQRKWSILTVPSLG